jgi:hypothetical protein
MERGSYDLDNGTQVEAGSFVTDQTSSSSFTTVSFNGPFQGGLAPVVVAAVGSFNGTDTVTNRLHNISTGGFEFRMQKQERNVQEHGTETIYYIAWQPGLGAVNGVSFEVDTTGDEVTDQFYPIWFSGSSHVFGRSADYQWQRQRCCALAKPRYRRGRGKDR